MELFRRIFYPQYLVKPSLIRGELPAAGTAYSTVLRMSWPSALEQLLVALMGIVDMVMVSGIGTFAISAVGITNQPKFLFMAPMMALNIGVTAVVARRKGAGNFEGARRTVKQCLLLGVGLCAVLMGAAVLSARPILKLAGAQPDYIEYAMTYFRIIMCGQFFGCLGMIINAAQRGYGNTRIALISSTTANVVNVLFNYLLINGVWVFPKLGVTGAAIATALGSFVAFLMALISVLKPHTQEQDETLTILCSSSWRPEKETLSSVARVSAPALVEQLFARFGFFTYVSIVARLGTVLYATHQICMQLVSIAFSFGDGLGIGGTALVGQSLGAERPDMAMMYGKIAQRCALMIGVCLGVVFVLFRGQLIGMFSRDAEVIARGMSIMYIVSFACLIQTQQTVLLGCLRGAGDSRFVAIISFVSIAVVRPLSAYLLCYTAGLGLIGAWLGYLIDQTLRLTFGLTRFNRGKWAKIRL